MYNEIQGTWGYAAGTSGTVTPPAGSRILSICAHATTFPATVTIFGGTPIPIIADPVTSWFVFKVLHGLCIAQGTTPTIVFTGTDSYFVEYVKAGNN